MALVLQMSQSPCVIPPELNFSRGYIQSASNFVISWIDTIPVIIPTEGLDLTQSPPPFFREGLSTLARLDSAGGQCCTTICVKNTIILVIAYVIL